MLCQVILSSLLEERNSRKITAGSKSQINKITMMLIPDPPRSDIISGYPAVTDSLLCLLWRQENGFGKISIITRSYLLRYILMVTWWPLQWSGPTVYWDLHCWHRPSTESSKTQCCSPFLVSIQVPERRLSLDWVAPQLAVAGLHLNYSSVKNLPWCSYLLPHSSLLTPGVSTAFTNSHRAF